jgi:xanthine dehydrogenase accessory factor
MAAEAAAALRAPGAPAVLRRFTHEAPAAGTEHEPSGMVCGGTQTVLLRVCSSGDRPGLEGWARGVPGHLTIDAACIRFDPADAGGACIRFSDSSGGWRYDEDIGPLDTVHIIGGGHVGRALATALAPLPLRVEIIDPRPEIPALFANDAGVQCRPLPYAEGAALIRGGADRYVVIATPGHTEDYTALRAVVDRPVRYLAVVGSRRKAGIFRARLLADGVPEDCLRRVHLPAGLPIGSRTPAEIAISIAAEIIAVRNGLAPAAEGDAARPEGIYLPVFVR